ncbi:phage portal protein [Christensenellaceae bacterium OttesenSCG-928-L17]|nr:phage portal protein [Christensenellaceae bacterium OttesenSCG-928-L17]
MRTYFLPKGTLPTAKVINQLIDSEKRKKDIKRYAKLEQYYLNEPTVSREAPHELLAIVNHARYITKINTGYLLGNPVEYVVTEGNNIQPLIDQYRKQTISDLDITLAKKCSIFGRAYERIYSNEDADIESAVIDPRHAILVYDDSVKHKKMFGITYMPKIDESGEESKDTYKLTILTDSQILHRELTGNKMTTTDEEDENHFFGEVPMVEYANDDDYVGDYEPVITLIDAYNILQSDRVLDRERLVDAILALYGIDLTEDQKKDLKEGRMISGIPLDAKLEYIIKNINEADADVLRKTLAADIHKISMTPDMSDENFVGNSSGVAILYKLLPFENNVKDKERHFERALMDRFHIYNQFLSTRSKMKEIANEEVDAIFKRALPQNDLEISQIINNLIGLVDKELLVSQLSFVRDSKETIELAGREAKEDAAKGDNTYNSDNYGRDTTDSEDDNETTE